MKQYSKFAFLGLALLFMGSCSKDDNNAPDGGNGTSKYVFVVYSEGTAGEAANYIVTADDLSAGEISIKNNGVETSAYSFLVQHNTLFGITYADYGPTQGYKLNASGELQKTGNQVNTEFTGAYTPIEENAYVGVSLSGGITNPEATLYKFDAANIKVAARKSFSLAILDNGEVANYNAIKEVGNKLYMPLSSTPGVAGKVTDYIDNAWIAVFDKETLAYEKLIVDDRIGPIGNWFGMQGVEQIDNGDVYAWSTSASNASHTAKNPSAIIKINADTDEIDPAYYFNVEEQTGKKIARGTYLKDGKFLMTLYENGTTGAVSGGTVSLAIVDVIAKTVTPVSGIANHDQMPYDNKVFVENNGNTAYYIFKNSDGNFYSFTVNVDAASAQQGVRFVGIQNVTAISRLTYE